MRRYTFEEIKEGLLYEYSDLDLDAIDSNSEVAKKIEDIIEYLDSKSAGNIKVFEPEYSGDRWKGFEFNLETQAPEIYTHLKEMNAFTLVPKVACEHRILWNMEQGDFERRPNSSFTVSALNQYTYMRAVEEDDY